MKIWSIFVAFLETINFKSQGLSVVSKQSILTHSALFKFQILESFSLIKDQLQKKTYCNDLFW